MSCISEYAPRSMRIRLGLHAMEKRYVVNVLSHMGKHRRYHFPTLPRRFKIPRATHDRAVLALKGYEILFARQRLAIILLQHRLMLPKIHMGCGPGAKDLQYAFRSRLEMRHILARLPRTQCLGFRCDEIPIQQLAQAHAHKTSGDIA